MSEQVQLLARIFVKQPDIERLLLGPGGERRACLQFQTVAQADRAHTGNERLLAAFAPFGFEGRVFTLPRRSRRRGLAARETRG